MMSEFNSLCVGEAGLRVSRWQLGLGCAWWGPGAAHLQWEQKVFGARGVSGPVPAVASWENRKCCGQNPHGNCVSAEPCPDPCCCCCSLIHTLYVMQVCCLLICQICWLRCKWVETDCRDFQIAKHTKAGTSSGYLWINNLTLGVLGPVFH